MRIAGILPAAGSSSRLGSDKLLVELDGEPLVRRAARRALDAALDPVIVVVGQADGSVTAALAGLPLQLVTNPRPADGLSSSVRVGIATVPPARDAAVVVLPDMPLVTTELLRELRDRYEADRPPLVITLYGDTPAPPVLYDRALWPALASSEEGGFPVVREHRERAGIVRRPADFLLDIDLPADLARLRETDWTG